VGRIGAGLLGLIAMRVLVAVWAHFVPDAYDDNLRGMATSSEVAAIHIVLLVHLPAILLYLLESSYAHIQLGVSRAFGVVGSENFRAPFLATSPREFWHRWNITLFRWLRDYVYKPLRGRRGRAYRRLPALVLVFVYCGLLHGPEWRCAVWGLWMGGSLAAYLGLRGLVGRGWREPPAVEAPRGRTWSGLARRTLARLLVYEWFCIGVTIMLDVEGYGWGMLQAYGRVLFGWMAG
jgi:D-alanyl-lipoteichoic acid acyltransferase DltB (MBOAT superfamily)